MPLTATQLFDNAQLEPSDYGPKVTPNIPRDQQKVEAIAFIGQTDASGSSILTRSMSEVSLPLRTAMGDYTTPMTNIGLTGIFGTVSAEVISQFDAAQVSFARSELNKLVDSSGSVYDKDSDQDRAQAMAKLKALIEFVTAWKLAQNNVPPVEPPSGAYSASSPNSQSVRNTFVW